MDSAPARTSINSDLGMAAVTVALQIFEKAEATLQDRDPRIIEYGHYSALIQNALASVTRLGSLMSAPLNKRVTAAEFRTVADFEQDMQAKLNKLARLRAFMEDVYAAVTEDRGFFRNNTERIMAVGMHFGQILECSCRQLPLGQQVRFTLELGDALHHVFTQHATQNTAAAQPAEYDPTAMADDATRLMAPVIDVADAHTGENPVPGFEGPAGQQP